MKKEEENDNNKYLVYGLCFGPLIGMGISYIINCDPVNGIIYGPLAGLAIAALFKSINGKCSSETNDESQE